jgi:hypothetical protein
MRITDEDCDQLRRAYLQHEGIALTCDEVREMLSRLSLLFEHFAAWVAKEKAAGRVFEAEVSPGRELAFQGPVTGVGGR